MSTSVCLGYVSFSTTVGQFRQPSMSYGAVASVSQMGVKSWARDRGLGGLALAALDELEPAVGEPHPALTWKPDEWSIWGCDMLPGVMAGKRPAPKSIGSF
jgi:hypothetical protein